MFFNRESLDQVSNSKAPFVFVLDFSMAEHQQPEVTANVTETEVLALEAEAVPKSGSPVPPTVETTPPEGALTESNELTSTMSVELTTARAETGSIAGRNQGSFHLCGRRGRSRGNFKVDQSDVVGSESTKIHFTGSQY